MGTLGLTYLWFIRTGKSSLWKFLSQVLRFPKSLFPSLPISVKCSWCFESCQCKIRQDFDMHCVTASCNCFQYIFILTKNISSIWIRRTIKWIILNSERSGTLPVPYPMSFPDHTFFLKLQRKHYLQFLFHLSIAFLYCLITYTFIMSIFYLVLV